MNVKSVQNRLGDLVLLMLFCIYPAYFLYKNMGTMKQAYWICGVVGVSLLFILFVSKYAFLLKQNKL